MIDESIEGDVEGDGEGDGEGDACGRWTTLFPEHQAMIPGCGVVVH